MKFKITAAATCMFLYSFACHAQKSQTIRVTHFPGNTIVNGESKFVAPNYILLPTTPLSCFPFLEVNVYVNESGFKDQPYRFKVEVKNNSSQPVDLTCSLFGFGKGGGGRVRIYPGQTRSSFNRYSEKYKTIEFSKVNFSFDSSIRRDYGLSYLSDYLECGETLNSYLEKAKAKKEKEEKIENLKKQINSLGSNENDLIQKLNLFKQLDEINNNGSYTDQINRTEDQLQRISEKRKKTEQEIGNLKSLIGSLGSSKDDLLEKKNLYKRLSSLDEENDYNDEIQELENIIQKNNQELSEKEVTNSSEQPKTSGITLVKNTKARDSSNSNKKESEKDKKVTSDKSIPVKSAAEIAADIATELRNQKRNEAASLLARADAETNPQKKSQIIKRVKDEYSNELTSEERTRLNSELVTSQFSSVTSSLSSVSYARGQRRLNAALVSGLNFTSLPNDDFSQSYIPIGVFIEGLIPLSNSFAIEIQGEYSYNLPINLNLDAAQGESILEGVDTKQDYQSYYYALGASFGSKRGFSLLISSYNLQYFVEDPLETSTLGSSEFNSTYGLTAVINGNNRDRNEYTRVIISYLVDNSTTSFLTGNKENDVNNINARLEYGLGALLLSLQYNRFEDVNRNFEINTFQFGLGIRVSG